jgi:hypothetical protein
MWCRNIRRDNYGRNSLLRNLLTRNQQIPSDRFYSLNYKTRKIQYLELTKPRHCPVQMNTIRALPLLYRNWFFTVFDITLCTLAVRTPKTKQNCISISQVCAIANKSSHDFFPMAYICRFHCGHSWWHEMYPGGIRLLFTYLKMLYVTIHMTSLGGLSAGEVCYFELLD